MKVTYNWLKEFVDINISAKKLAEKLTLAGLEVVSLEKKDSDFIFEIEITSNRPDWLSVIGIAREVASITGKKINIDATSSMIKKDIHKKSSNSQLKYGIIITDKNDCPLYSANIIKNIRVVSSPGWLKKRLES